MKSIRIILAALILGTVIIAGVVYSQSQQSQEETQSTAQSTINVMVSILPQKEFVQRVGGEYVNVQAMIREGYSPATYEATPEQMQQLEDTELYVRIGYIPFEQNHMDKIAAANPDMTVVDGSEGIETRTLGAHTHEGEEEHDHEEETEHEDEQEHEHEEESIDPHIWLSPSRVEKHVQTITNALVELRPEQKEYFKQNAQEYIKELQALDTELQQSFEPFQGKTILVYHPAFGYLADDYGFTQEHIEIQGKEPSLAQVQEIIDRAREENISVIFVQKQFSTQSAEAIAQELNGSVIQINPLAENYIENMNSIAQTITSSVE